MKMKNCFRLGAVAVMAAGVLPARAELPMLSKKDWLGYFVGVEGPKSVFGITTQGKASIRPIGEDGPVSATGKLTIPVAFAVEEILPDGETTVRNILPESLTSSQEATNKPENVVIKGKVTGDAEFEVYITEARGVISLGGRLLNPGKLKNPLKFSIKVKFPDLYTTEKDGADRKAARAFGDKTRDNRMEVIWTDGKRTKISTSDKVEAASKEINGPGISTLETEFSTYEDKRFVFTASPGSAMTLSNTGTDSLHHGFTVIWTADPAKDPEGKARLNFQVK